MSTIPASAIVQVTPGVLSAGGRGLDIVGMLLTTSARVPIGSVQPFSNATDVATYFGLGSNEAALADVYFAGFDNSNLLPQNILFTQYPTASVAAYLRGAPLGITLTQLKALATGTLVITCNGSAYTAASVNLSTATSFSNAATIIQTAFGTGTIPFGTTYDSISSSFAFTSVLTGTGATMTYASTGALATSLLLTQATGAVISQGAVAATPGPFMTALTQVTQDWATFMTCFDPDSGSGNANKLLFAQWNATQVDRWAYICWDSDASAATVVPATTSLGYLLANTANAGTCLIYAPTATYAAFICGAAASIDFTEYNGRITFAFRSQAGLQATVTDQTTGNNLIANGYNFYGAYATANDQFIFFYPGIVTGNFKWLDSYIDQIWLNQGFQLALMVLLTNTKSIPYNQAGYTLIKAACLDQINAGLNFGAFRAGITLSQAQAAEVNNAAGLVISTTLNQVGWYLQVLDASPQVRAARGSPPCTFWYMDGGAVQKINLASIEIQ